jgi:hypothetical protein
MIFNPIVEWLRGGIISARWTAFLRSPVQWYNKLSIVGYLVRARWAALLCRTRARPQGIYLAMASAVVWAPLYPVLVCSGVPFARLLLVSPISVALICIVIFGVFGFVSTTSLWYRLRRRKACAARAAPTCAR